MKILSRMLVTLLVLLGVVFLVMLSRAYAAGKAKCQGSNQLSFGVDANGCETVEPLHNTESQIDGWINNAGVSKECYKIRFWRNHQLVKEKGTLDVIQCVGRGSAQSKKVQMLQPSGSGQTQRIMFTTPAAKEAFERQIKSAKK